jgi:hypothetical protein
MKLKSPLETSFISDVLQAIDRVQDVTGTGNQPLTADNGSKHLCFFCNQSVAA